MATQKYARCSADGVVIETWQPPESLAYLTPAMVFEPTLAATFHACPAEVGQMWLHVGDTWTAPGEA